MANSNQEVTRSSNSLSNIKRNDDGTTPFLQATQINYLRWRLRDIESHVAKAKKMGTTNTILSKSLCLGQHRHSTNIQQTPTNAKCWLGG